MEYWIIDVEKDVLLALSKPAGKIFQIEERYGRGDSIAPKLLPDCTVPVSSLLP